MAQPQYDDTENMEIDLLSKLTPDERAKRLEIRQEFRKLIKNVEDDKEELLRPENYDLLDRVKKANELFTQLTVRTGHCRENVLDSHFMASATLLAEQKANSLQTNLSEFKPDEFVEKLITKMDGRYIGETTNQIQIAPESWRALGTRVSRFFVSITPAASVLSGTFQTAPLVKPTRKPGINASQTIDTIEARSLKVTELKDNKEATSTEELERIYGIIQKLYEEDPIPIDYFELIVNPSSFGHTIENIFHVSFLVRDGLVRIHLNEHGIPEVIPILTSENNSDGSSQDNADYGQAAVSLSMDDWKEIVEIYKLDGRVPFIEPATSEAMESGETMDTS